MTFSNEWDARYVENTHLSQWPWSDVVSLVYRYCRSVVSQRGTVLELGCGAGANIPFFHALGVDYHAIEGSPTIVGRLHERFPDLAATIVCADFTCDDAMGTGFDLVLDRAALTHNDTRSIERSLASVHDALRPGGTFIGVDWFSTNHDDATRGVPVDDGFTRTNVSTGSFAGVGKIHFTDEARLRELFKAFEIVHLEEKIVRNVVPKVGHRLASWNIVARKADE